MSIADQLRQAIGTDENTVKLTDEQLQQIAQERAEALAKYNEKLNAPINFKQYTAEEIFKIIEDSPRIKIDQFNRRIIKLMCLYFTKDERCAEVGLDVNKGLFLYGGTGVGKTTLMEFFRRNENHCYMIKPCVEIARDFASHNDNGGWDIVPTYAKNRDIVASAGNFGQSKSGFCFDDLGQEPETKSYGESVRIMAPILEARYVLKHFNSTHITTNVTPDQIEQFYGARVRSRCGEMFNIIQFPNDAPDRRKEDEPQQ